MVSNKAASFACDFDLAVASVHKPNLEIFTIIVQVVPQYLLPRSSFLRVAHTMGESSFLGRGRAFFDVFHSTLHRAAWAVILHQV